MYPICYNDTMILSLIIQPIWKKSYSHLWEQFLIPEIQPDQYSTNKVVPICVE